MAALGLARHTANRSCRRSCEGTPLNVGRLLETDGLGRPRLVALSACETGLYDITTSPDEFIGLPATFTALGAAGVLGTLWPVSDAASALLIAKFYELHMGAGLRPPTALRRAEGRLQGRHLTEIEEALSPEGLARRRARRIDYRR